MKDTCCKRLYKCKCATITEAYIWLSQLAKHKVKCDKCKNLLGFDSLKVIKVNKSASIRTPTKNR